MKTIGDYIYNTAGDRRLNLGAKKIIKSGLAKGTVYKAEVNHGDGWRFYFWESRKEFRATADL